MMFLWSCERLKINLLAYECRAEGTKLIELDHTEIFHPGQSSSRYSGEAGPELPATIEARIQRALKSAQKYSLVANSIKSEVVIEPVIEVIQ